MPADPLSCTTARRVGRAPCGRAQRGQASLEYAGVLAIVATVLVITASVAGGGAIFNGVLRGLELALCRVTGGDCLVTKLAACTVRSSETGGRFGLKLTLIKLGASLSVLRQELSDGTVDVTLIDGNDAAPTAALGASGGVRLGGDRVGGGAIATAELLVRLGRRRVWHRPDAAAADRLIKDIRKSVAGDVGASVAAIFGSGSLVIAHALGLDGGTLPTPDVSGVSAGVEGAVEANLDEAVKVKAGLKASLGGTRDRKSGQRTFVLGLTLDGEASGALTKAAGAGGLGGSAGPTVTLTYDREGKPTTLAVAVAGTGRAELGVGLPRLTGKDVDGSRVEVTSTLDLAPDANREVYDQLLDALASANTRLLSAAIVALAGQLETAARRDVVRYATETKSFGADAEAAVGARAGGSVEVSRTTSELQDAWTRPAGGAWEQRTDCVGRKARAA